MKKESIREKRIKALYEYSRSSRKDKLLVFLMANITHKMVKEACEDLGIKVK